MSEPYRDVWKMHIPDNKLDAYKSMIDDGHIQNHRVIYDRSTGSTTVEYYAIAPHEWILDELKKRSEAYARQSMPMP